VDQLEDDKSLTSVYNEDEINISNHECNPILMAEDNPNILKKYETTISKLKVPWFSFLNGLNC